MKTKTKFIYPAFATLALACFALSSAVEAVTPAPDGGYPGGNTAEGQSALLSRTTGAYNTAVGFFSLRSDTTGSFNTAIGAGTLLANTADENTATGAATLLSNTTGTANTADGAFALSSNTTGSSNTAIGRQALFTNSVGNYNTANGDGALYDNTTGNYNTAIGYGALNFNSTGSLNIAVGQAAGHEVSGDYNIDIGNIGLPGENRTIRIGDDNQTAIYLAGIAGQTVGAGGTTCYVDNDGKLGVFLSARRYKDNIQSMGEASKVLLALKPVTFRYKPEFDKESTPQFGLVAEEVAEVNPDLVTHDAKGDIYTVRYEAVNAMLLNEFLKEHRKVEEQGRKLEEREATIARLKKGMDVLTTWLDEQDSKIEKLSGQLGTSKPAPPMVLHNQSSISPNKQP